MTEAPLSQLLKVAEIQHWKLLSFIILCIIPDWRHTSL